ncbi:MAG: signal recognition particle-docking protein FtsY [Lachnospiraceae bacterium]|nr:signal recognition particle-docking protein FtsY [Lachnospiraceae bacterium]
MGLFARLKEGLTKSRENFVNNVISVFDTHQYIDDDFYDELEEILVMGDVGVSATEQIIEKLKEDVKSEHLRTPMQCKAYLIKNIKEQMRVGAEDYEFLKQRSVVMVIGVNGVGKTTTIGKLAAIYRSKGKKVLIAAADTFRAAATEQLEEWAHRANVDIIKGKEGSDPSSVLYDAVNAANARGVDVLLVDTAGRLHNKKNLMEELKKMHRIVEKNFADVKQEYLIVLDGTTGQNALVQAREFSQAAPLSGIVITKMDGTAKGGIAIAIQSELGVPVKFIGVGEKIEDLQEFDPDTFVDALFDFRAEGAPEDLSKIEALHFDD